ncbi:nuclear transport factor 2 family protein [Frankia sp. R43]|uniref:nuclear transport factor 2 family protein n=1 Tax=Frankia sp. R43 TaxID=269536 RepID=UPI0009F8922A|nr:nuclear transport factor 2 family protein [Frankia sp. R43]
MGVPAVDPGDELRSLGARLRRFEDLEEIRQLYIDYGRHLDAGDPAAYASLFARDARLRLGPVMRADGREEIEKAAAKVVRLAPDGSRSSVHLLASPRIELTAGSDTASGECVWAAISSAPDGAPRVLVGRHVDVLVREDGRWCFARRAGLIDIGALGPADGQEA